MDYIYAHGIGVKVYSSGIYCANGQYSSIPVSLLNAVNDKIDALIFNYEAIDADQYASIVGTKPSNIAFLEESIKNAIALGIPVEAHLVPMHCNYREIPGVLNKLFLMGVKSVSFLRLVPQGRALENKELVDLCTDEKKELQQILSKSEEIYKDKIRLGLPFSAKHGACATGIVKLTVRYDGFVFPCEAFKDGVIGIVENITPENVKEKSLIDIYENSAYLRRVRDGLNTYLKSNSNERCFGQYCRLEKKKLCNCDLI